MKRLFLIAALAGGGTFPAHSQSIAAMAEQLVELKLLEQTTGDGYQLMTDGLDSIGEISANEYALHTDYFTSLGIIKPAVNDDPVLQSLRETQSLLIQQLQARLSWWRQQQPIDNLKQ